MKKKAMTGLEKQISELAGYEAAEIADELLEKLGICVCLENDAEEDDPCSPCFPHYRLRDKHGNEVLCKTEDWFLNKFATGNGLLEAILSDITSFDFSASERMVKNPFLRCRSLEEAKIRMDLAGEDGNA